MSNFWGPQKLTMMNSTCRSMGKETSNKKFYTKNCAMRKGSGIWKYSRGHDTGSMSGKEFLRGCCWSSGRGEEWEMDGMWTMPELGKHLQVPKDRDWPGRLKQGEARGSPMKAEGLGRCRSTEASMCHPTSTGRSKECQHTSNTTQALKCSSSCDSCCLGQPVPDGRLFCCLICFLNG
jgi:hypothetical protein